MEQANPLLISPVELWKGCILASCAHAVMLPEYPFLLNEHIWKNGLYITQDQEGAKAALVFSEESLLMVGVFRTFDSNRTELVLSDKYAVSFFKPALKEQSELAKALFPIFEEEIGEKIFPVVTTGFWLEENKVYSVDSYDDWYENGGHVLEYQMKSFEEAMIFYQEHYDIDIVRADIIERVYKKRIESPFQEVTLTKKEIKAILEHGSYNREACEEAFRGFSVFFEK